MANKISATYKRKAVMKRRKKNKRRNSPLYLAISIFIIIIVIGVIAVCVLAENCDFFENSDTASDVSSQADTESSEDNLTDSIISDVSYIFDDSDLSENEISEVSEIPDISDISEIPDISETSEDVEISDIEPIDKTKAYEEYIGVDYAIDMTEYEQYVAPENEKDYLFIVNPDNPLPKDFVPKDLVKCTNIREGRPAEWSKMDRVANYALEAFLLEAKHYGFDDITVTNAYRSYSSQASIFSNYVKSDLKSDYYCDKCNEYIDVSYEQSKVKNGSCTVCNSKLRRPTEAETTAHVLTYSTRAGTSEHQSGLCCDMHNLPATTSAFDNTPEAIWLAQNAHRFGFILRYPEGKQHITGIKHESWHFRYVGRTAATEMFKLGVTLDEYLG